MESYLILGVYTFPYKTFNELNPTYAFQAKTTRFRTLKGGGTLRGVFCLWDDGYFLLWILQKI